MERNGGRIILILAIALAVSVVVMEGLVVYVVVTSNASAAEKFQAIGDNVTKLITTLLAGILGWLVGQRNGHS